MIHQMPIDHHLSQEVRVAWCDDEVQSELVHNAHEYYQAHFIVEHAMVIHFNH